MSIQIIRKILFWSTVINFGLLAISFLVFAFFKGLIFRLHGKWFNLTQDNFNSIFYLALAIYKILIIVFNFVPLIAFYIAG